MNVMCMCMQYYFLNANTHIERAEESARKANEAMALVQQENMKKIQELENRRKC